MAAVSLNTFKAMLRVDFEADDALLVFYLDAAQAFIERHTRRPLSTSSKTIVLREWPTAEVTLPFPPFQSITSITYRDTDGATQSLTTSNYEVETDGALPRVRFYGSLPDLHDEIPRVTIVWSAGYTASTLPHDLQLAVMRLAGTFYMNPEAVSMLNLVQVPFGVRAVIDNYACPTLSGGAPE